MDDFTASSLPAPALAPHWAALLDRFDQARRSGRPVRIEDVLPPPATEGLDAATRRRLLEELIQIDLECGWRFGSGVPNGTPRLEDYVRRFPGLLPAPVPVDLIAEEYRVRSRWGDRPKHEDYLRRFAGAGPRLHEVLRRVDAQLATEFSPDRPAPLAEPLFPHTVPPASAAPNPRAALPTPTAGIASAAALLDALCQWQLLSASQLNELTGKFSGPSASPRELACDLLRREWLTPYQVNQLLQGRVAELVVGHYLLLQRLGEGGAGQVFKARHQKMNRLVALKVIRPELLADAEAVGRFHRESQVLSRLDHPNVVHAYDAGRAGAGYFLAMEYVEGTDLARLVKQCGPLPVMQACAYIRQAALGLQHAHERGLVHRDIKPHNLIMSLREGRIKVADLGLARLPRAANGEATAALTGQTGGLTPAGAVMMGTADYLAPEQALDFHKADIRADIYSLGCTLWYLLIGQPPFPASTLAEKLLSHQTKQPPALEKLRPDVPAGLAGVVRRMLAKQPDDRYQTPAEVAEAVTPYISTPDARDLDFDPGGWSVRATVSTTWQMLCKFAKRNKAFTTAVVVALILLTWSSVANYRARRALERTTRDAVPALIEAARMSIERQRFDKAQTQIDVALAYDPDQAEARLLKGQLLILQKEFARAKEELQRYRRQQPGDTDAGKLVDRLMELCSRKRPDEDGTLLDLAHVFAQQKMPALAEGLLAKHGRNSFEAKQALLKLYQARIEKSWPGLGNCLSLDPSGIYRLDLYERQQVTVLDPLEGIPLTELRLATDGAPVGVSDLTPLKGMPLARLDLHGCRLVQDISPLQGLPLTSLNLSNCSVQDISPLRAMRLTELALVRCGVRDLAPLKGMPLTRLDLSRTGSDNLSFLKDMPLLELQLQGSAVQDLSPLKGITSLTTLVLGDGYVDCQVRDLSPLSGQQLTTIHLPREASGMKALRGMKTLTTIHGMPSAEFWKKYDAGEFKQRYRD